MTATDNNLDTQGKAHYTLFEESEDAISGQEVVVDSKTEPSSELSDNEIRHGDSSSSSSTETQQQEAEEGASSSKKHARGPSLGPQIHPPPKKEYGFRWSWNQEAKDYTQVIDGVIVRYREYQRNGGNTPSRSQTITPTPAAAATSQNEEGESSKKNASTDLQGEPTAAAAAAASAATTIPAAALAQKDVEDGFVDISLNLDSVTSVPSSRQSSISIPRGAVPTPKPVLKEYQEPLDEGFTIVDKPKRFFQVGRIFATVWFEPGGENPPGRKPDLEWTRDCPKYHDEKPIAKFRWFVVVRKRLHHSLCFNITTIGPKGPRKADRGRGQDFVVLHNSNVEPSKPFEVEGITRDPIAVIIEAGEESISPWARLDCGRIYTVEDNLKVMKIGRVHTASLPSLETYFKESVL